MQVNKRLNTRVLVIDDEESIRDGFRMVLSPSEDPPGLLEAASVLFDDVSPSPQPSGQFQFEVDVAADGREGLRAVERATQENRPYAAIFCDMRMPGWDGIETVEKIRRVDERIEIVFVTAYSDYSTETIIERTGADVGYFVKPFLNEEVKQLATKLVLDWNKARELEELMRTISMLRGEAPEIERLLQHMLDQICAWIETDSAALVSISPEGHVAFRLGVGTLSTAEEVEKRLSIVGGAERVISGEIRQLGDGTWYLPIKDFGLAVAVPGHRRVTPDRRILLRVFLTHAALALSHSEAEQRLARAERLATVGQALSSLLHDIRGPVGVAMMLIQCVRLGKTQIGEPSEVLLRAERQLSDAVEMLADTLGFCKGGIRIQPKRVALKEAFADLFEALDAALTERGVSLRIDVPEGLYADLDSQRLGRALWNLVRNGADAALALPEPRVRVWAAKVSGGVELTVADTGPGVPPELEPHLFEPFATSGKVDGTGLGLAIVRQIVEAHRGRIQVCRADNETQFRLFFPTSKARDTKAG